MKLKRQQCSIKGNISYFVDEGKEVEECDVRNINCLYYTKRRKTVREKGNEFAFFPVNEKRNKKHIRKYVRKDYRMRK